MYFKLIMDGIIFYVFEGNISDFIRIIDMQEIHNCNELIIKKIDEEEEFKKLNVPNH